LFALFTSFVAVASNPFSTQFSTYLEDLEELFFHVTDHEKEEV